jgi:hypothetical protein
LWHCFLLIFLINAIKGFFNIFLVVLDRTIYLWSSGKTIIFIFGLHFWFLIYWFSFQLWSFVLLLVGEAIQLWFWFRTYRNSISASFIIHRSIWLRSLLHSILRFTKLNFIGIYLLFIFNFYKFIHFIFMFFFIYYILNSWLELLAHLNVKTWDWNKLSILLFCEVFILYGIA